MPRDHSSDSNKSSQYVRLVKRSRCEDILLCGVLLSSASVSEKC